MWDTNDGVVELPSGRRVRGRSWHAPVEQFADVTVVLTTTPPEEFVKNSDFMGGKEVLFVDWPDYRLPRRPIQALKQLREVWERAESQSVEIVCAGGVGRTGTALAVLGIFEGMTPEEAIAFVQREYNADSATAHPQRGWLLESVIGTLA